jgi:hypothetical protein
VAPHAGQWAAWLGGAVNEISDLSQTVTLPSGSGILLRFYYRIGSQETSCDNDMARVLVNAAQVWQVGLCQAQNTANWVVRTVDVSAFAGRQVTIHFRAETNASLNSNLFLDDVSFLSGRSDGAEATLEPVPAVQAGLTPVWGPRSRPIPQP